MKRSALVLVIVANIGMLGWTVYDFVLSSDNAGEDECMINVVHIITSTTPLAEDITENEEVETELDQKAVRLSDLRDERVIVNFWATWCTPCREEIPDFQKLYDNKDVEILAVNMTETEKSEDDVSAFADEFAMTFPVLLDVDSDVSEAYQFQAYPTTYIIDSNGHIQYIAI